MRRQPDLYRAIVLQIEQHPHGFAPGEVVIPGATAEEIGYHVFLLGEAGLVLVADITHLQSPSPQARAIRLTSAGHDFADQCRPLQRWEAARATIARVGGGAILSVWQTVLDNLIHEALH